MVIGLGLVQYDEALVIPSCTEGDPNETVEHGCDTDTPRGSICVVVAHEPCPSALDFIKCVYVLLGVGA